MVPEVHSGPARGLDHFVLAVRDLQAAQEFFQALGFTTTPRARHPWGTENILVQMQGNFIELLGVTPGREIAAPGPGEFSFGHYNQNYLQDQQGLSMLVFSSEDAGADRQCWLDQGLQTYAPFDFSRTATLDDGRQVTVAFSLAFVSHGEMPWATWFVCQQHYPENFWKPAFQQHVNGAQCVDVVILAASDPSRYQSFLEALFSEGRLRRQDGGSCVLELPRGRVLAVHPQEVEAVFPGIEDRVQRFGPLFAVLKIRVASLRRVAEHLLRQGIVYDEVDEGVVIPPTEALGLSLIFHE